MNRFVLRITSVCNSCCLSVFTCVCARVCGLACVCMVYHTKDKGAPEQFARGQFPCNFVDNLCHSTNEVDMRTRRIPISSAAGAAPSCSLPLALLCTLACI